LYCEIDLEDSNVIQDTHKALSEVFQEEFGDGSPQNTSVHVSVLNLISAIRKGDRPPRCMADNDRPPLSTYLLYSNARVFFESRFSSQIY